MARRARFLITHIENPLNAMELFETLEAREGRASTMFTSQPGPDQCYLRISSELCADSMLIRAVEHARFLDIKRPNMREYTASLKIEGEKDYWDWRRYRPYRSLSKGKGRILNVTAAILYPRPNHLAPVYRASDEITVSRNPARVVAHQGRKVDAYRWKVGKSTPRMNLAAKSPRMRLPGSAYP